MPQYRFEKQIIETRDFVLRNGRYPKTASNDKRESNLGYFISAERTKKRQAEKEENSYPTWKLQFIDKEIPDFCWNSLEESFAIFLLFLKEYIKKTGKSYVEKNVIFNGYKLGKQFRILKYSYDKGKLPNYKKDALLKLGITFKDLNNIRYRNNWNLLEKSDRQKELISKALLWKRQVKVIDLNSSHIYVYSSANKVSEALCNNFRVAKNVKSAVVTANNHLSGKVTTPYKGRFMFYYATDEEVKKYLEDNKAD